MPGNETIYKSSRAYLPVIWVDNNIPPNAARELNIAGAPPGLRCVPMPQACSVTSISVLMSEEITSGSITVSLCKNGVPSIVHTVLLENGVSQVGSLNPGDATFVVGDTVGIHVSTPAGFTPAAQIDLIVFLEVQNT